MADKRKSKKRLIVSEKRDMLENSGQSTSTVRARAQLYELIAGLRKEAAATDDPKARTMFEFATEVVVGLVRAFRNYDDGVEGNGENPN